MADLTITINPPTTNTITISDGVLPHNSSHAPAGSDSLESWYATVDNLAYVSGQIGAPAGVVYATGNQDISGVKNFFSRPTVNGSGIMLSGEIAGTGYLTGYVQTSQTGSFVTSGNTGNFVTSTQTGQLTGVFYPYSANPAAYVQGAVVRPSNTGNFVDFGSVQTISGQKNFNSGIIVGINSMSGTGNSVLGGSGNSIAGNNSSIGGGIKNFAGPANTFVGGGSANMASGSGGAVVGGFGNQILSTAGSENFIGGGFGNKISAGTYNSILGGYQNQINLYDAGDKNFILGGEGNSIRNADNSFVIGGESSSVFSLGSRIERAFVVGSDGNAQHSYSAVITDGLGSQYSSGERTVVVKFNSGIYLKGPTYFFDRPTVNGTGLLLSGEATAPNTGDLVDKFTAQTITGTKSFDSVNIKTVNMTGSAIHVKRQDGQNVASFNDNPSNSTLVVYSNQSSYALDAVQTGVGAAIHASIMAATGTAFSTHLTLPTQVAMDIDGSAGYEDIIGVYSYMNGAGAVFATADFQEKISIWSRDGGKIRYTDGDKNSSSYIDLKAETPSTGRIIWLPDASGIVVLSTQTGDFYPRSNPSGYITGVDLSSYATAASVTGISGYQSGLVYDLQSATGSLNTRVTSIEGVTGTFVLSANTGSFLTTGAADLRYVGLTGDQNVSGVKNFVSRPTVNNTPVALSGESSAGGKVLQMVYATKTDTATGTSTSWTDILSASIIPASTGSKIVATFNGCGTASNGYGQWLRMARNSSGISVGDAAGVRIQVTTSYGTSSPNGYAMNNWAASAVDVPIATGSVTYSAQISIEAGGTYYINRSTADANNAAYPRGASTLILMELAP